MLRIAISVLVALIVALPAAAQGTYQIKPGDVLSVEVLEDPSLNRDTLVLPDGSIVFPLAGTVQAGGRSISQLQNTLISRLAPNFATEPTIFVSVASLAGPGEAAAPEEIERLSIYGIGELANPGIFEIEPGTTMLQFLAASGGFSRFAATKRIQIRRRDPQTGREVVYRFNYDAVERGARIESDLVLREGDVVVVPERRLFE